MSEQLVVALGVLGFALIAGIIFTLTKLWNMEGENNQLEEESKKKDEELANLRDQLGRPLPWKDIILIGSRVCMRTFVILDNFKCAKVHTSHGWKIVELAGITAIYKNNDSSQQIPHAEAPAGEYVVEKHQVTGLQEKTEYKLILLKEGLGNSPDPSPREGSGLLDLTRNGDDVQLGSVLDEITPPGKPGSAKAA
jgi:hypothetical protein